MANGEAMVTLMFLVFMLGIRHGFEPDHLAVIDGMTRCAKTDSALSKWIGLLFSFGHGLIVVLITIMIGIEAKKWNIPLWFDGLGIWISILSLFFLGIINLYTVFKTDPNNTFSVNGPINIFFNHILKLKLSATSYWTPIFFGMLFSLSFDTLSQTIAFSFNAYTLAGQLFPVLLGIIFMIGMMMTDGLNGYLVAHILNRADKKSKFISQGLGFMIGGLSLAISIYYVIIYFKLLK